MDCCLWLNRKKISSAAEIIDNFDLAAIRGYFLGGSLSEWLREHNGDVYADVIDTLDPSDEMLNDRLARAFGITPGAVQEVFCGSSGANPAQNGGSFTGSFPAGSGMAGSWSGSFFSGSFGYGSYQGFSGSGSSFGLSGSYRFSLWEWEWEWRFGRRGSFSLGSFGSYLFGAGSYSFGSFGSFQPGSFPELSGSFTAGSYGSGRFITADEYDRIMYECLRKCPLNCYGYGIHII